MDKTNKVPELRFGGFTKGWEEKKLNEFSTYHSSTLSVGDALSQGKYKLYDANEIIGFTNENGHLSEYITIIKDGSGVGRVRLMQSNTSYIGTMGAIRPFASDVNFLYCCLLITDFNKFITGATIPHVYYSDYGEEKYLIPSIEEQIKIGNFFENIDKLITEHQQKHSKLKSLKKAMLDKMFPKEGQVVPEIRFKGFEGEWKSKLFKDLCWFQEGPGLRHWQFTEQGIKVINVTNLENGILNLDRTNRYISLEEFNQVYKHFEIDENDIVVASSGNSYGKVSIVRKQDLPLLMNTSVIRFKATKDLNHEYLLTFLKSDFFKDQIDLLITGGAQPNFGPFHLNKILMKVPSNINEQVKVGNYFKNLDTLIGNHENQMTKLSNIKKAFLSKMFV